MPHAVAEVDLAAIGHNITVLRRLTTAQLMAVVKADGYGHGMVPAARAALAGGASWLGVATLTEALAVRAAGVDAPLLAWLWSLDETDELRQALAIGVSIGVSSQAQLAAVQAAAPAFGSGRSAVHLKVDTGLSRSGARAPEWGALVDAAAAAERDGRLQVTGVWSHFACADEPGNPANAQQLAAFHAAWGRALEAGLRPQLRHLANSAALLTHPASHLDLVRVGIAGYGLSPVPAAAVDLRPAMTLEARVALVKRVPAGTGVSYGHRYRTERATTLALVPLGYADGIPRAAGNVGPVAIRGRRFRVSGQVCMDQFVVDVGELAVQAGDRVVVFGAGGPSAQEWADALGTIHYEIVTRVGARVPRSYLDVEGNPV